MPAAGSGQPVADAELQPWALAMKLTASPTVLRFLTSSSGMRDAELLLGVDDDGHHRDGVDVQVVGEGLVELDRVSGRCRSRR